MLKIGLTGGIGSGKTTISDMFGELGTPVIDTDVISRKLTKRDDILEKIAAAFGTAVISEQKELDRNKLAQLVFDDDEARSRLEDILHPEIREQVSTRLNELAAQLSPPPYVIIVIPLLFETGFREMIDRILVVTSQKDTRLQRVLARDDRSAQEIRAIMDRQTTDDIRIAGADDCIINDRDITGLEARVKELHTLYQSLSD